MLVTDTSAFVSLSVGGVFDPVLSDFTAVTTEAVLDELEQTAEYDDRHGQGASAVIDSRGRFDVVDTEGNSFVTNRIDAGEASCVAAVRETDTAFLVTDDFRALPELRQLVDAEVVLSPVVLLGRSSSAAHSPKQKPGPPSRQFSRVEIGLVPHSIGMLASFSNDGLFQRILSSPPSLIRDSDV